MDATLRGKNLKNRFSLHITQDAVADGAFIETEFDVRQEWIVVPILSAGLENYTLPRVEFIVTLSQGNDTEIFHYFLGEVLKIDPQLVCEGKRIVNIKMYNRTGGVADLRMTVNCYVYCND